MATKKKTKGKKKNQKRLAGFIIDPSITGSFLIKDYATCKTFQEVDTDCLIDALSSQIQATKDNDLTGLEGMLTGQAYILNAMFNRLSHIAISNIDTNLKGAETCLKLGLRAQSQCRSTIEAISAVKNPPIMGYVKQANIAQGPQQVNNGIGQDAIPRAGEKQNVQNELLEVKNGNQLDTGTQNEAIEDDSAMETLGKVHRG